MGISSSARTGPENLKIQTYETLAALETLRPAWRDLLDRIPNASTFSTWEWLAPWWRAYAGDHKLHALSFHDGGERLIGLALLAVAVRKTAGGRLLRVIRLMGDGSGDSDNLDLLVLPGCEENVIDALLRHLDTQARNWDLCEFNTLPEESVASNLLEARLRQFGWKHFRELQPGVVIELPQSWEDYRKQLSYNERAQLGKYLRRLERDYDVHFWKCTREDQIDACLATLFRLHEARWQRQGDSGLFAIPQRRRFYSELSQLLLGCGSLEFWFVDLDGTTVGAEFDFRYRDTVYSLQGGVHPEYWDKRIGYVLRSHVLQQCIAGGVRRYDFLGGAGGYKERWAGQSRHYRNIHFAKPWSMGSVYLSALYRSRAAKEWLRSRTPRSVWGVLQRASGSFR